MEAGMTPKRENFASETIMLTRMSASDLHPFFMLTGPIVWKNNTQQCFTALKASPNKKNDLMYSVTADYCSAMPALSNREIRCLFYCVKKKKTEKRHRQMDRRRQRKEMRVRCPWESGPWGTLIGWSAQTDSVPKACTDTTCQLKQAEMSLWDWWTPPEV